MTHPWPDPLLEEREDDLGWLALSPLDDRDVRIGVTAPTDTGALDLYAVRRRFWWDLQHADERSDEAGKEDIRDGA